MQHKEEVGPPDNRLLVVVACVGNIGLTSSLMMDNALFWP